MERLCAFFFFLGVLPLFAADERDRFYQALDHRDIGRMEGILKDWEKGHPEEAEVLVARGFYFRAKAQKGKNKPTPIPTREEVLFTHPSGWPEPPIGSQERLDPKLALKAVHYWRRAVQLYPWRLDIPFKLAGLYGELEDFESQNDVLGRAFLYAEKNRGRLKWENGTELPLPYHRCASRALGGFIEGYLARHRHEDDLKALRLSKLLITFFPNNPYGYNFIAAYFSTQPDWPYALKYLMLAYEREPENSLVLENIGNVFLKLGKRKEAKVFYKKVVALGRDERLVMLAKEKLD